MPTGAKACDAFASEPTDGRIGAGPRCFISDVAVAARQTVEDGSIPISHDDVPSSDEAFCAAGDDTCEESCDAGEDDDDPVDAIEDVLESLL